MHCEFKIKYCHALFDDEIPLNSGGKNTNEACSGKAAFGIPVVTDALQRICRTQSITPESRSTEQKAQARIKQR
jgi:hypothetical protein